MNRHVLLSAIVAVVFVCSGSYVVSSEAPGPTSGSALQCELTRPLTELFQYDGNPLDLEGCQQYCRSIYNVDPYWYGPRGSDRGRGVGYGVCIQDCNRKYWKAWDKDLDEEAE
jgi:hypothetical protein